MSSFVTTGFSELAAERPMSLLIVAKVLASSFVSTMPEM